MQDLLLLAAAAAPFVFGWFLIKRLDNFLENNCHVQELQPESGEDTLRIGFSNPSILGSISDVLEQYSDLCSDGFVSLFHGTEEELLKGLSTNKLNVIFLSENAVISVDTHYNVREVLLSYTPVIMKYGGPPIEPIAKGRVLQKVLWSGDTKTGVVRCFMECLNNEFAATKPQKQKL